MKRIAMVCVAAGVLSLGCAGAPALQEAGTAKSVSVPVSALPQPGECRIYSPEKGEQSPSGSCAGVVSKVKSGDWMLSRGVKSSGEVQVFVYGELGVIRETYLLDATTGKRK